LSENISSIAFALQGMGTGFPDRSHGVVDDLLPVEAELAHNAPLAHTLWQRLKQLSLWGVDFHAHLPPVNHVRMEINTSESDR
jgi:hypothetical protein